VIRLRFYYHIPIFGPYLRSRAMRKFGREIGEAFQRGVDSVRPEVIEAMQTVTRGMPL